MKEKQLEDTLQAKGLNAPRVTPLALDSEIAAAEIQYHQFPGTTVTVAAVKLRNGYVLVGKSAAASPLNFDPEIGRQVALKDAREQLWALLGFRLRDQLTRSGA